MDFPETFHDASGEIVAVAGQERWGNMDVKCVPARPPGKTKDPRHRRMRVRDEFPLSPLKFFGARGLPAFLVERYIYTLASTPRSAGWATHGLASIL